MVRRMLTLAIGIGLGAGAHTAARHDEKHQSVRVIAARDIAEKVDGK